MEQLIGLRLNFRMKIICHLIIKFKYHSIIQNKLNHPSGYGKKVEKGKDCCTHSYKIHIEENFLKKVSYRGVMQDVYHSTSVPFSFSVHQNIHERKKFNKT